MDDETYAPESDILGPPTVPRQPLAALRKHGPLIPRVVMRFPKR